jgi:hypothetical protein
MKILLILLALCSSAHAQLMGRAVPAPIYGVTFDRVGRVTRQVQALASIAETPTVRVVFDKGEGPNYYKPSIQQFRPVSYVMGELVDSSYMSAYSLAGVQTLTRNYTATLGSLVDIWEIGNEINGDWLGTGAFNKMAAMFDIVYAQGGKTALTFFYEGEAGQQNCIDSQGGMFPWIARYFQRAPTAESEKIRLHVDYVFISWYPSQCQGVNPNWPWVYTQLADIFPNSAVGFGELGTPNPQGGSAYEKNLIGTYYPLGKMAGLPASYVGGYFWWYAAEEMVPWPGTLGDTLNAAIAVGP